MVVEGSTGLRRLGAGLGAGLGVGLGAYAVSLAVRAGRGIYLLGYPNQRRRGPKGWSAMESDGYRAP